MRFAGVADSFNAIFRKEFVHLRRDRATMVLALTIPVFQLILFGFLDQTVRHVPTVVVDLDRSSFSRELIDRLTASGTFRVIAVMADFDAARGAIVRGEARVAIGIPTDYGARLLAGGRGEGAQVLTLIDGSDSVVSAQTLAAVNGLAARLNLEIIQRQLAPLTAEVVSPRPLILFNPAGRTANYIIPGLVAIILQLVALVLAAVAIVRERERGTLEQLLVTPVNPIGLVLGKLFPYLLLGVVEMALILLAMRVVFAVPIRGSVVFLFVMAVIYLFALLAMGLFISARARTQAQAQQLAQVFFLPAVFLSGYIFPFAGLPWPLQVIGRVIPATHMIEIMRGVVLRGAGPLELWRNVLALVAISAALVALSVFRFRKVTL